MDRTRVAIGLGSNLGDRLANLRMGYGGLRGLLSDRACSRIYESAPMHVTDQPDFLNACCVGFTDLSPRTLLEKMQEVERTAGRESTAVRLGPRSLDLDLLIYDDRVERAPGLILPHPRMSDRAFVLIPLAEIAAEWIVPGTETTVDQLTARADPAGVELTQYTLAGPEVITAHQLELGRQANVKDRLSQPHRQCHQTDSPG